MNNESTTNANNIAPLSSSLNTKRQAQSLNKHPLNESSNNQ